MKHLTLLLVASFISLFTIAQSKSGKLVIIHTNDLHSNITGFSPELEYTPCITNNDKTLGGFARIATIISENKEKYPNNTIVLDAGDFLMGTFFHVFETQDGFQLNLMEKMGFDVVGLGNHEFDFGPEALTKIIKTSMQKGAIPPLTLANVEFNDKDSKDDSFEELYNKGIIKKYHIIERDGMRIGVFGLLGRDADEVAPKTVPLKIPDYIKSAKKTAKILKKQENVDFVICVSHSGVVKDKKGNWVGEDIELAKKVKDIDVIISGHTHVVVNEPIWIDGTPIVQTGAQGKNVGRFELNIQDGEIKSAKYQLIPVNDEIKGDCKIHQEIAKRIRKIDDELLKPLKLGYYKPLAETDYLLYSNEYADLKKRNLGPLIADALRYYVNNYSEETTDIALIAAGVIRDKFRPGQEGVQTVADAFRVMSLGNGKDNIPGYPLAKVYLTGREIKNFIELLIVATKMKPAYYCFYSGIEVKYNSNKRILHKIQSIKINDKEINFSKKDKTLYSLTANSYMLEFVGEIKGMTLGLIKIVPKDKNGNPIKNMKKTWIDFDKNKNGIQEGKEWLALVRYLQSFEDTNNNKIPDFPDKYKTVINRLIDVNTKK